MPSYRRGFAALGIVLVGACGGATASRGVDADGGAPPNDPNAVCVVRGDDCVGRDDCCPPITAALIDVQHACVSRRDAPIKCPPPVPGCQRSGMPLATCFMEDTDSGDAKVYYSSNYFVGGPGYKGCTPEISEVVNRAEASCPAGPICVLEGDRCVGQADCCPPIVGKAIDLDRRCAHTDLVPFVCGAHRSGRCVEQLGMPGCYIDATGAVYATPSFWSPRDLLGFQACTAAVAAIALEISDVPCP